MRTLLAPLVMLAALAAAGRAQVSPFTAARHAGADGYEVRVDERWHRLVELEGIGAERWRAHCETNFGERALKRFSEDLLLVMEGLGVVPGEGADLVLESLDYGRRLELSGVPMTRENRQRCLAYNREEREVRRVARQHAREAAPEHAQLATALELGGPEHALIAVELAAQDLDQLEWHVQNEHSYRDLLGVDVEAVFDAARLGLGAGEQVSLPGFALVLMKILAVFGDGHARLEISLADIAPVGYAPYLLADAEGGAVAFLPDRSGLLDTEHPFLVAIDGRPLAEWLAAAGEVVPRGAPHFVRERSLRELRHVAWARLELGLSAGEAVEVTLASARGAEVVRALPLAASRPVYGDWPRAATRMLPDRIGYLRIASMDGDPEFLRGLRAALESLRESAGLVIDVRGNGGGSRDALREVLPCLLAPGEPPLVANVAAYRLRAGDAPDGAHLADRFLWPASFPGWRAEERAAIEAAASRFRPDFELPAGEFGEWCFMVVSRDSGSAAPFHLDCPVVVLMDSGCFSATDVFLGALAGRPRVTLLGTPSGGGSGRSRPVRLAHSGLALQLSSMASFRPDGRRYDGRGIEPDVLVRPAPADLVGAGDAQLAAALALLRGE